jgi:hypothetical protein
MTNIDIDVGNTCPAVAAASAREPTNRDKLRLSRAPAALTRRPANRNWREQ